MVKLACKLTLASWLYVTIHKKIGQGMCCR
jgi:hypothetical protein